MPIAQITPSGGGWSDADIASNANITATKLQHRQVFTMELFGPTTEITALTKLAAILPNVGGRQIVGVSAAVITKATGADRTVTVDLQRSTGGAAFATVLSSTISFDDDSVVRTAYDGVLSSSVIEEDDLLEWVITVAGSADAQAKGLVVGVTIDTEKPA